MATPITDWGLSKNKDTFAGNYNPLFLLGGPLGQFAGLVSASYKMAGNAQNRAEGIVDKQIADLGSWYKRESGQNFLDTESVQSALAQLRSSLAETFRTQGNQISATGGTAEAALAGRTQANKNYSDAVSKLVGYNTDRKDQLSRDYQYRLGQWLNSKMGLENQKAQNWSNVASSLVSLPFQLGDTAAQLAPMLMGL